MADYTTNTRPVTATGEPATASPESIIATVDPDMLTIATELVLAIDYGIQIRLTNEERSRLLQGQGLPERWKLDPHKPTS